jgi:predicted nucleic acid-binding protein
VTAVLDSGGVSALAANRERVQQLRHRGEWPPIVPSVVLTETLTGDHHRDHHENRLLKACDIRAVDERLARVAAVLRRLALRERNPSAVDAVVVALADWVGGAIVLTSDPHDFHALAEHAPNRVAISAV